MAEKLKVIAVVGPTASGKTALGIFLAQKFNGEIISADSRQIYKGLDAIARIPSKKERAGIPHHLLQFISPKRLYSSGEFVLDAKKIISKLEKKQKLPIVVGGTGFYADTLLRGLQLPQVPPNAKLRAQLEKKTAAQLFALLKKLDKKSAARIDSKNPPRLIRAIEIAKALGKVPLLSYKPEYDVLWLGLRPEAKLHEKVIRKGVEERLSKMIKEAKKIRPLLSKKNSTALGFELKPILDYFDNPDVKSGSRRVSREKILREELVETLIREELGYVKRQWRWFKRREDIHWVKNPPAGEAGKTEVLKLVKVFLK